MKRGRLTRCATPGCPCRFYKLKGNARRKCTLCLERGVARREENRLKRLAAIAVRTAPAVLPISAVAEDDPPPSILQCLAIIEGWQRAG